MKTLRGLVPTLAAYWGLYRLAYPEAGRWHEALVLIFLTMGLALAAVHEAVGRHSPEGAVWVILGGKVVRLLLAIALLAAVRLLRPEVPIVPFAIDLIGIYLVGLGYEIFHYSRNKTNHNNDKDTTPSDTP